MLKLGYVSATAIKNFQIIPNLSLCLFAEAVLSVAVQIPAAKNTLVSLQRDATGEEMRVQRRNNTLLTSHTSEQSFSRHYS